jgi:hypothetical protein
MTLQNALIIIRKQIDIDIAQAKVQRDSTESYTSIVGDETHKVFWSGIIQGNENALDRLSHLERLLRNGGKLEMAVTFVIENLAGKLVTTKPPNLDLLNCGELLCLKCGVCIKCVISKEERQICEYGRTTNHIAFLAER